MALKNIEKKKELKTVKVGIILGIYSVNIFLGRNSPVAEEEEEKNMFFFFL